MDRIAAMNAFVRVVEAGTFAKAADTLDLPNATVTRLIQRLEADLKVRLLHRTTRSVTVTPEGAIYYERVVRLLADLADLESSTTHAQRKPSGRIHVDVPTAIGTLVLVPALADFYLAYPDVEIDLDIGNRRIDLLAEGIDCSIRAGEVEEQFLVARQIGTFGFTTCATRAFLDVHGTPASPEQLRDLPTVGMAPSRGGRALPFQFSEDDQNCDLTVDHRLVVDDTNAYLAAGLASLGIIQAPTYSVRAAIAAGTLVPLLEDWQQQANPVHVIYPPNRYLSAKVRVFIDWVIELFEQNEHLKRR
ncbi:LysR family transcriptional regulator [Paraburkholderia ginsengiterrae]|uniref:LysR family transcriptional regulator n=1 Tax=Paraburkholderia ginsengiterrae TaxID=1462993 RepID=A0A1A9N7Q1_9BURK|nr:LysR family transcriptional regulator [Paraburkholderia ginsengiterrae]OAJ59215.1 LysR family transcriptional regulator [Paraburkholderia ginsengiterrae]OAJ60157.1 LysR family transcriptional regulator [Paraburkholderia ginsengiterrae]